MPSDRPNILWICTDQQRYDTIHALGNQSIRTPNLDRLAAEGVAFTRVYTQSTICTPSRASFLTGRYPSSIHVHRNGNAGFPGNVRLITRTLADAGYDCGLAGKLHLSAVDGRVEVRPDDGYRVFKWSHHPYPERTWPTPQHAYQQWLADHGIAWDGAYGAATAGVASAPGECRPGIAARHHQTTWCVEEALAFIAEKRSGPWLMSINPFDPHPPFDPPPEYMSRMNVGGMPLPLFRPEELHSQMAFRGVDHQTEAPCSPDSYDARLMVAAYYAQIELIDDQVGRLLRYLDGTGQRRDTLIIFTSDHGEMLGDHGLRHKGCRFYEGAVHVPLIISWPGHVAQGLRSGALVELTDLVPTLLDVSGLPIGAEVEGKSLYPLLSGCSDIEHHRDFVRAEYHDATARRYGSHANMIRDDRYKLVIYHGLEIGELYDLERDPQEFANLWDEAGSQQIRQRLIKTLFDAIMLSTDLGQPRIARF